VYMPYTPFKFKCSGWEWRWNRDVKGKESWFIFNGTKLFVSKPTRM